MSKIVNHNLHKIAKGMGIVIIGTVIGMFLALIGRIIIIRYVTPSEYGIYSIAITITTIFVTISTLGLPEGSARYIAYFRGKREKKKIKSSISSSIKTTLISSIIFFLILFFSSDFISTNIFHSSELSTPLKILSVAIPFTVLMDIFTSLFRGFDIVSPQVYFQNVLKYGTFILFLLGIILFGLSLLGVIYAYLVSIGITCTIFVIYTIKKLPLLTFSIKKEVNPVPIGKELLIFSLPLLAAIMLRLTMNWTAILMLGFFKTPDVVGLFNGALPLAQLIPLTLFSMVFIYTPIISQMYSKNLLGEIKRSYSVLTKWNFSITLPLFLIFIFFPDIILDYLFGPAYVGAAIVLQLLALGFFVHTFLGPNGATLTAMGKTKILMYAYLASTLFGVFLNILLIPKMGITGAAIATASSMVLLNVVLSIKLYFLSGIHPLTKNYLKPIITSVAIIFVFYFFAKTFFIITVWYLIPLFLLFIVIYGLALIVTKSFDQEDIALLLAIEKTAKIDTYPIKRILKRFI